MDTEIDDLLKELDGDEGAGQGGNQSPDWESKIAEVTKQAQDAQAAAEKTQAQYQSLQGIFNSEKNRAEAAEAQNAELMKMLQAMQTPQQPDPTTQLTPEDLDRHGETLSVTEKQIRNLAPELLAQPLTAQEQRIADLEAALAKVTENQGSIAQSLGDFQSQNALASVRNDPNYMAHKAEFDAWRQSSKVSGSLTQDAIWNSHLQAGDESGLKEVFDAYMSTKGQQQSAPAARPVGTQAAAPAPAAAPGADKLQAKMRELLGEFEKGSIPHADFVTKRDQIGAALRKVDPSRMI